MKNYSTSELGYTIQPFMMRLGLSARELMAYALVYSFTLGPEGFYYGRRKTMAAALSTSARTLSRTIESLISKGLIEIYERHGVKGLRATVRVKESSQCDKPKRKYTRRTEGEKLDKAITEDPSAKKKNAPTSVSATDESRDSLTYNTYDGYKRYLGKREKPKFDPTCYGKSCAVVMTKEQYEELSSLVPASILAGYIASFEDMLNANSVTHHRPPHNHYKTIRKWIEDDMRV